jgi:glucose-1-phosphate adenylyltransferase
VILVLSGDHIYQMDYRKMIRYHNEHDADLTAAFIEVPLESASRFGVAEIADDFSDGGRMLSYEEKPAAPKGRWASLTVFCFRPSVLFKVLKKNQENTSYEFGRDIIPMMMREKYKVHGYKFRWLLGLHQNHRRILADLDGSARAEPKIDLEAWGIRTNLAHRNIADRQPVKIGRTAAWTIPWPTTAASSRERCAIRFSFPACMSWPGRRSTTPSSFLTIPSIRASLNRVVSDVNTVFNRNVRVGTPECEKPSRVSVIGWNNIVPEGLQIGCGCRVAPRIAPEKWPEKCLKTGRN